MITEVLVLILLSLLVYAWAVYPFILTILARGNPVSKAGLSSTVSADVSILLSAYNEEGVIRARLENLCRISASIGVHLRLNIFVGVDASTDKTAEIAREFASRHDNIHVMECKERRGKVAVLKDLVRACKTVDCGLWTVDCKKGAVDGGLGTVDDKQSTAYSQQPTVNSQQPTSSILVFTDANTMFKPDAIDKLLSHFSDPAVGGVCGRLVFKQRSACPAKPWRSGEVRGQKSEVRSQDIGAAIPLKAGQALHGEQKEEKIRPAGAGLLQGMDGDEGQKSAIINPQLVLHPVHHSFPSDGGSLGDGGSEIKNAPPEGFYWRWETQLKVMESALDSCLGANGAIYAIRSELFWSDIPDNTVVDDLVIGMKVREQGFKMIYEPDAIATEEFPEIADEWGRRVRIGAGDYQALGLCRSCMLPRYGTFAWIFWSHKVLRWFTPHMVLLLVICSLLSVTRRQDSSGLVLLAELILAGIFIFLLCALAGTRVRALAMFRHFVVMQTALFAGFLRFCKGNLRGSWERTARGR